MTRSSPATYMDPPRLLVHIGICTRNNNAVCRAKTWGTGYVGERAEVPGAGGGRGEMRPEASAPSYLTAQFHYLLVQLQLARPNSVLV